MPENVRRLRHRLLTLIVCLAATLVSPAGAAPIPDKANPEEVKPDEAAASPWFETKEGQIRLVAETDAVGSLAKLRLGIEFRMASGWKIYWRSPGDAGFPPGIDWAGSGNLAGAEISWPAPHRFSVEGLETVGYEEEVVLPVAARLEKPGKPLSLRATVNYLTCKELCVPYTAALALDLPVKSRSKSPGFKSPGSKSPGFSGLIDRFEKRVPAAEGTLMISGAGFRAGAAPVLRIDIASVKPLVAPDVFIEGPAALAFGAPKRVEAADRRQASLLVPVSGDNAALAGLAGQKLRLTLIDGTDALDRTVAVTALPPELAPSTPPPPSPLPPATTEAARIGPMLLLALFGGFILNLMPCVLPVLSIKLMGVIYHAGRSREAVRMGFVATACGILVSFLGLALAMVALKQAGLSVGWGMQFQQPVFLIFMAVLLAFFAANLFGLFTVPLPGFLADFAASAERPGMSLFVRDFSTGIVATLLATPCTAPYLGTAIGFALAGGSGEIIAIFLALGLGMSLPYLAVAVEPRLVSLLPRPGHWMVTFRRVQGGLFAATSLWLFAVLFGQSGFWSAPKPAAESATSAQMEWQTFDPAAIDGYVKAGRIVLVDVTADWCINCKVNESLVLGAQAVRERLAGEKAVLMRADWTRPDEAITRYLQSFGRYGIPFNVVYGPAAPRGLALSEILTVDAVLDALKQGKGNGG